MPLEQVTAASTSSISPSRRIAVMPSEATVTGRAVSSGAAPARVSRYARWPPTLIALTPGGTCSMSPVSGTTAARTAASGTSAAPVAEMTVPSASSVSVAWPSRMVAR